VIDFDQMVTQACVRGLGMPVSVQLAVGGPLISTLSDRVTPLMGILERAMRELRDDPKTGAVMVVAKPQLGMSLQQLISAGITVAELNNGVATITIADPKTGNAETWKVAVAEGPDSGGNVKISLLVTSLTQ
jgi:hypothetical protein